MALTRPISRPRLAWLVRQTGTGRKVGQTPARALVSIGDRGTYRVLDPGRPREVSLGSLVSADGLVHLRDQVGTQRVVLEVISAYLDPDDGLTVLRGQRHTVVAAKVGTPSGTVQDLTMT